MPSQRKQVTDEVMTRVAHALDALASDDAAPRTKRQLEMLSGLSHDAVARAFRQDANEVDSRFRLNEKMNRLTEPLSSARRSPVAEEQYQDKQKIAELKHQVRELNHQLDRYAMSLFAHHIANTAASPAATSSSDVVPIGRRKAKGRRAAQ